MSITFKYRRSVSASISQVQTACFKEEEFEFKFDELIRNNPYALEYLDEKAFHFAYFDFDCYEKHTDETTFLKKNQEKQELIEKIFSEENFHVKSLCHSSCKRFKTVDSHYHDKFSFHIVLEERYHRTECKRIADYLNKERFFSAVLDLKVYGLTQAFRLVGATKFHERRPKLVLLGTKKDSILTCQKQFRSYHENDSFQFFNVFGTPMNEKFSAYLVEYPQLFTEKSNDYDSWMAVCMTLAFQVKNYAPLYQESLDLFNRFSELSLKFNKTECKKKFDECIESTEHCQWNFLKSWIPNKNKRKRDFLSPIESLITPKEIEEFDEVIVFNDLPSTFGQYLVTLICSTARGRGFLRYHLSRNPLSLCDFLRCNHGNSNHAYLLNIWKKGKENFGDAILCPYGEMDAENASFVNKIFDGLGLGERLTPTIQEKIASLTNDIENLEELISLDYLLTNLRYVDHELASIISNEVKDPDFQISPLPRGWNGNNTFERILKSATSVPFFRFQYPFHELLKSLYSKCDGDLKLFRFHLLMHAELLTVERYFHFFSSANDDLSAANIVYSLYPYFRYDEERMIVFSARTGMWYTDEINVKLAVCSIIGAFSSFLEKPFKTLNGNFGNENYGKKQSLSDSLFSKLTALTHDSKVNMVMDRQSGLLRLLFLNGMYDGTTSSFYPVPKVDVNGRLESIFIWPEMMFYHRVPRDFKRFQDSDLDEFKNLFFYDVHGKEVGDFRMETIACALFGVKQKTFMQNAGASHSGKSTEIAWLNTVFPGYVQSGEINELCNVKNDSRDPALKNQIIYRHWNARILMFSENALNPLNVLRFKLYCSGRLDPVLARPLNHNPSFFVPHFYMMLYANDPALWDAIDEALRQRGLGTPWNKCFIPSEEITDPNIELPRRPEIEEWLFDKEKLQLYAFLFVRTFEIYKERNKRLPIPQSISSFTVEVFGEKRSQSNVIGDLLQIVFLSGREQDFLSSEALAKACEEAKIKYADISIRLKKAFSGTKIRNGTKSFQGKRIQGWYGMSLLSHAPSFVSPSTPNCPEQWKRLMKIGNGTITDDLLQNVLKTYEITSRPNLTFSEQEKEFICRFGSDAEIEICNRRKKRAYDEI